ncbi:MAG: TetR/AcrR family transcriptional regulator [Streptococcaceae bacterium]|nr:TetR/AcrR family transcriptional regulator [Streptococcaceae bacterium]
MVLGTREKIINAYFRMALKYPQKSSITLSEIAKEAGVSRQTIYKKHYRNTEDIIEDIHKEITSEIIDVLQQFEPTVGQSPLVIFANEVLPLLYKHREWLRTLYTTSMDPSWERYLEAQYANWVIPYLIINEERNGLSQAFLVKLAIKQAFAIISTWLSEEHPQPPETFKNQFLQLVSLPINNMVKAEYKADSPDIKK